jgi:hypothetical protein
MDRALVHELNADVVRSGIIRGPQREVDRDLLTGSHLLMRQMQPYQRRRIERHQHVYGMAVGRMRTPRHGPGICQSQPNTVHRTCVEPLRNRMLDIADTVRGAK